MASQPTVFLTEEEYLRIEDQAETKSEYANGEMFAMAGASLDHVLISSRILFLLSRQVSPHCRVFGPDVRIRIAERRMLVYADCSVVCGPMEHEGGRQSLMNPLLIVEVLSPSTEAFDRGRKFESYRTLPSFREYLLVHQDQRRVEHYSKQDDGSWVMREYAGAKAAFPIPRLDATISLGDLYATVEGLPDDD